MQEEQKPTTVDDTHKDLSFVNGENTNPSVYVPFIYAILRDCFRAAQSKNFDQEISKLIFGDNLQFRPTTASSTKTKVISNQNVIKINRKPKNSRRSNIISVSGGCKNCDITETPQWRYVHREKFCNACYMRLKRWVHSNLEGTKLPCRARGEITKDLDEKNEALTEYIINRALTLTKSN